MDSGHGRRNGLDAFYFAVLDLRRERFYRFIGTLSVLARNLFCFLFCSVAFSQHPLFYSASSYIRCRICRVSPFCVLGLEHTRNRIPDMGVLVSHSNAFTNYFIGHQKMETE